MGCPRLTYEEENGEIFFQGLWKKSASDFFRVDYYPYGLQTANSWTRENTTGNNFLYNGGTELNTTTQVYDLHYRNYDPVLGRMNQVDPMASKYGSVTPYNFAFNAPTNMNDPLGDDPGSSASCSWCNPKPRPIDTGSGGGGGGSPYAGLMGRSAGFFEPGWQPGSGSLSAGAFASQDARYNAYHIRAGNGSALREGTYTNNGNGGFTYSQNGSGLMMFNVWLGRQVSPGKFAGRWTSLNRDVAQLMVQKGYSLQLAFSMDQTQGNGPQVLFAGIGDVDPSIALKIMGVFNYANNVTATAYAITDLHQAQGLTKLTPSQISNVAKVSKGTIVLGGALTAAGAYFEYKTGQFNTHSVVDIAVGTVVTGVAAAAIIFSAPVWGTAAAITGLGYGLYSLAGGSAAMDKASNDWGKNLVYGNK